MVLARLGLGTGLGTPPYTPTNGHNLLQAKGAAPFGTVGGAALLSGGSSSGCSAKLWLLAVQSHLNSSHIPMSLSFALCPKPHCGS